MARVEAGMCDIVGDAEEHLPWTPGKDVVTVVLDVLALTELGVVTGVDTGTLDKVRTTAPGNILVMFKGMFA